MTKEQCKEKVKIMIERDIQESLDREIDKLMNCGGIDLDSYSNDFLAPKIILSVALKNLAWQYEPFNKEDKAVAKNLSHF